jgi:serine/threonine protein phosphatase 1
MQSYFPKFISNPKHNNRFAIGDIHGCYEPLEKLLFHQLKITKSDQIFLLGDLISKGRNSREVLDLDSFELYFQKK